MCCFCLHFPDFIVLFKKKIKNLLQFTFERNNLLGKMREKKAAPIPALISNGPSLTFILCKHKRLCLQI